MRFRSKQLLWWIGMSGVLAGMVALGGPPTTRSAPTTQGVNTADVVVIVDKNGAVHTRSSTQPTSGKTVQASEIGKPIDNPMMKLSAAGVALLKKRGIDVDSLQGMKAVLIGGRLTVGRNIVNTNAQLMVVFGKDFLSQGTVQSMGPIIAIHNAHFMNSVKSDSLIWFVDQVAVQGEVSGSPVILAPNMHMVTAKWMCEEVWIGKYGWPEE